MQQLSNNQPLSFKSKVYLVLIVFVMFSFVVLFIKQKLYPMPQMSSLKFSSVEIGGVKLRVEVANTEAARVQGLSGREALPVDQGLLVAYPDYAVRTDWMKDMKFPVDLIWLKDNVAVGFTENLGLPTAGEIPQASSPEEINSFLEINAGFVKENGLKVGDKLRLLEAGE